MLYPDPNDPLSVDNQEIEQRLLDLRPTHEIRQEIEDTYTYPDPPATVEHLRGILYVELQDAELRDELETGRPAGCWCLGLGGRDAREYKPGLAVWRVTCTRCPEGREAAMRRDQILTDANDDSSGGQDRRSYSDTQDRSSYIVSG